MAEIIECIETDDGVIAVYIYDNGTVEINKKGKTFMNEEELNMTEKQLVDIINRYLGG